MSITFQTPVIEQATDIKRIFALQQKHQFEVANSTSSQRISKLKKLHNAVLKYRPQIKEALYKDYRKQ